MVKRQLLVPTLILLLAAITRLAFLDIKPPHFDEGINGWFCDQMAKNGYYSYDPNNYHGPLHFYVLFTSLMAFGRNLWALRLPVVLVSLFTIFGFFFSGRFSAAQFAILRRSQWRSRPGSFFTIAIPSMKHGWSFS